MRNSVTDVIGPDSYSFDQGSWANNRLFRYLQPRKMIGYLAISLFVTSFDVIILLVLVEIFNLHYLLAATLSYSNAVVTKFVLNKVTIFASAKGVWFKQFFRFAAVSIGGLILTNIGMFIGVDILNIPYLLTKFGCIGLVFIWTFVLHNLVSFRSSSSPSEPEDRCENGGV